MGTPESKLQWGNVAKETKYDYNPKLDGDMVASKGSLKSAEGELGRTMEYNVQLASDPCQGNCGVWKLPTEKENFKKDYSVPNFGADPDMEGTINSLKIA